MRSLWNLGGFNKADSVDETSENKEEKRPKKLGFLSSIVASMFGRDVIEVG